MAETERLQRGMYDNGVERPVIEQSNDIDGPFATSNGPGPIPADILALVHAPPSVDPEPETEPVKGDVDVEAVQRENPNSRFTVVDTPTLAPGTCILCKSPGGEGRQFIDLGIQVTWVGAMYFCTFCVTEAAKLLGLEKSSKLEDKIAQILTRLFRADETIESLQGQHAAAMVLLRGHLAGDCCTHDVPVAEPEVPESDIGSSVGEPESSDRAEQDADEFAVDEGPDVVPAIADSDKPKRKPPVRSSRPGTSTK
jgi:hypothetical protein